MIHKEVVHDSAEPHWVDGLVQQNVASIFKLLNYMRGPRNDRSWHFNPQRACGGHIDYEIKMAGLVYGDVGGLATLQYFVDVNCSACVMVAISNAIRHQATSIDIISNLKNSRQSDVECSSRNEDTLPQRGRFNHHDKTVVFLTAKPLERVLDIG